jgi:hypothetical protein
VWLEPVPEIRVERLDLTPDLTGVTVYAQVTGGAEVVVVISANGTEVAQASGAAGTSVRVDVPSPRLWTPGDPHLYSLRVQLLDGPGSISDEVGSYVGLRTIGLAPDPQGRPRITLNGRVTFLHGLLDQGYWPDGISTAPTDDALRFDLEKTRELGFNFVRKHVKVEPARWYFWADTLGLVVWQDMPSLTVSFDGPPGIAPDPVQRARERFEAELAEMVTQLRAVPSIVGWVPFNEGWAEFDTARVAELVKTLDPTRLVIANSGVNCCFSRPDSGAGDVYDDHTYVGPGAPSVRDGRAIVDGEYGGLGLVLDDHCWPGPPNAYEMTPTRERLTERYAEVNAALERVVVERGLSGVVYTQTTDVENEVNGLITYDRRVVKVDPAVVAKCVRAVIELGSS